MEKKSFEEQCDIYRKQQTVSGRVTQQSLDSMVRKMSKVTGHQLLSGRLEPLVDGRTGEVTRFIER